MQTDVLDEYLEILKNKGIKGVTKKMEEEIGLPIPKGVCICEDKDGEGIVIIGGKKEDQNEYDIWKKRYHQVYGYNMCGMEYEQAKNSCSGNYIRGGQ
jgi:hypothetical protein